MSTMTNGEKSAVRKALRERRNQLNAAAETQAFIDDAEREALREEAQMLHRALAKLGLE